MLRRYGCRGLQYRPGILIFDGTLYGRGAYTETAMTKKLTFALLALGLLACAPRPAGPVDYVDPFIGTGYHGHTYPGATTPFAWCSSAPTRVPGTGMPAPDTITTIRPSTVFRIRTSAVRGVPTWPTSCSIPPRAKSCCTTAPASCSPISFRTGTRRPPAAIMPWSYPVKISGWSLRRRPVRACTAIPLRARGRGRWSST